MTGDRVKGHCSATLPIRRVTRPVTGGESLAGLETRTVHKGALTRPSPSTVLPGPFRRDQSPVWTVAPVTHGSPRPSGDLTGGSVRMALDVTTGQVHAELIQQVMNKGSKG